MGKSGKIDFEILQDLVHTEIAFSSYVPAAARGYRPSAIYLTRCDTSDTFKVHTLHSKVNFTGGEAFISAGAFLKTNSALCWDMLKIDKTDFLRRIR